MTGTLTAPTGTYAAEWPVWSTTARLVVTDRGTLEAARDIYRVAIGPTRRTVDEAATAALRGRP